MRNEWIHANLITPRSGDRIAADKPAYSGLNTVTLGAKAIRLARLATSIHLAKAFRLPAASDNDHSTRDQTP